MSKYRAFHAVVDIEITKRGMTTTKMPLTNLMTTIYFTNHQKRQLVDFLKTYLCIIYVKIVLNVNFKSLHSNKTKSISALTLQLSKWGNYLTTKKFFEKFYKNDVFFKRYNKNSFRPATCYSYTNRYICEKSWQPVKLLEQQNFIDRKNLKWRFLGHR